MNKIKIIIGILILSCSTAFSQTHIKKIFAIEASGGLSVDKSYNVNIAPSYFIHKNLYLKTNIGFQYGDNMKYDSISKSENKVYFSSYHFDITPNLTLHNYKDINYLNLGGGITMLYNNVKNIPYTNNQNGFYTGALLVIEDELYFHRNYALLISFKQYAYLKNKNVETDFSLYRYFFCIGIKKTFKK